MDNINLLSDREAMGLTEQYDSSSFEVLSKQLSKIISVDTSELIAILESSEHESKMRFTAGTLLSFLGDPRINCMEPLMMDINGGACEIGISFNDAERVAEEFASCGVKKEWIFKECPSFVVNIDSFKMAKYCITNSEYLCFLKDTKYNKFPSSWDLGVYPLHKANHPVYSLSSDDAELYCKWLSNKTGRKFRLPTEYEWEYAAGGPRHLVYPWGNNYLPDRANTIEERIFSTTPVGMYSSGNSYFGVSDMAGNVEEYTSSVYTPYPNGTYIEDDLTKSQGSYRVARGGSFTRFRDLARSTRRHGFYNKNIYVMGFRLVEQLF